MISTPGFYDISEREYHLDPAPVPSLSRSLAHTLVDKSPAHAFGEHPNLGRRFRDPTNEMDYGTVAHSIILGRGADVAVLDEDSWRTKEARIFRDEAVIAGKTPILKKDHNRAVEMADACLDRVAKLGLGNPFDESNSQLKNETIAIWQEEDIWLRAMLDAPRIENGIIYDLKTTESAHPKSIAGRMIPMGYDMQDVFYRRAVTALMPELAGRLKFVFIFVESKYPFAVTPVELNGEFKAIAQSRVERAVDLWRKCTASNHWPAYASGVITVEPKPWDLNTEFGAEQPKETMEKV